METIRAENLQDALEKGLLVDVRTPVEFEEVHLPGSFLHPVGQANPSEIRALTEAGAVYVLCRSGSRATQAIEEWESQGIENLFLVEGGILACEQIEDLPLRRGKKTVSLERQVRIAAGALILAGIAVGALLHPVGFGLSAFVGAGLVFAGITDSCAMGMLIAKMPWNQRRSCV